MRAFPDRPYEEALAVFKGESGMIGMVSMRGILELGPCQSELRVGLMKLFGPFHSDFLVPWKCANCRLIELDRCCNFFRPPQGRGLVVSMRLRRRRDAPRFLEFITLEYGSIFQFNSG